jgi:flagellar biosynthesis protein FlhF
METKTYRVRSLSEAMQLIAADLGPEASVLHTRRLQPRTWKWWDRSQWEVVAGVDPAVPDRFTPFANASQEELTEASTTAAPRDWVPNITSSNQSSAGETRRAFWTDTAAELHRLGTSTETIQLLKTDLESNTKTGTDDPTVIWENLMQRFASQVSLAGAIRIVPGTCTRVALVGPTGVGKTTTIAKLAADFHLRLGRRVGLITVDTFRVAAIDQLQAYAGIMDLPLLVVRNASEMQNALTQFADFDLVLIDTVGRSPRDQPRIDAMNQTLAAANLDHLLITLSASSDERTLETALAAHTSLTTAVAISLVLTKVDECHTLAPIYPFLRDCQLPWRYWTNGQHVPDDLGVARADVVAWFLGEIELVSASSDNLSDLGPRGLHP